MVAPRKRRSSRRHILNAWMNGEFVGTWTVAEHKPAQFQYANSWIASARARPISLSLPFLPGNPLHKGEVVENFFENLLPDNKEIRERLRAKFSARGTKAFDLLAEIGRDCVGAIQLLPEGDAPEGWNMIRAEPLTDDGVENALKNSVSSQPHLDDDTDFRISIAGAQEKTALLRHNGQWHKPLGATPTTHILKLPLGKVGNMQADMKTSVENEWMCSRIAEAFDLPVAHCDIDTFGATKTLIVERFDRKRSTDGTFLIRLPQEDMCQAKGVSPARKYEADGGVGIEEILELLRGSTQQDRDRRNFFKAQILFWMLAATDGHAKNYSLFIEKHGSYRMTPLYDILSAWPVIGNGANQISYRNAKLSMAFRSENAHYKISEIQRRHFNAVAMKCGIGPDAEEIIHEILGSTQNVIDIVTRQLPENFPDEVSRPILNGLKTSAERLERMPVS